MQASLRLPTDAGDHVRIDVGMAGERRTLDLDRTSVRGPHFQILKQGADGDLVRLAPVPVRTYRGRVLEEPAAVVSATIDEDGLRATIWQDGAPLWHIRPARDVVQGASADDYLVTLAESDAITPAAKPNAESAEPNADGLSMPPTTSAELTELRQLDRSSALDALPASLVVPTGPFCGMQQVELGLDLASDYYAALGSDDAVVQARIEESINAMNAIYVRDALLEYQLGTVIVRESAATDPYAGLTDQLAVLAKVRDVWNGPELADSAHDVASVITQRFEGSGYAYLGTVCSESRYAACGASAGGRFDLVLRHELGHSWNAEHYAGGFRVGPDLMGPEGPTIMSNNALSRISGPELQAMIAYRNLPSVSCLDDIGPFPSPVDPYGRLDRATVAAGGQRTLDVLANDHDANCEALVLGTFDAVSDRGGTITRSTGTGPGGRDELHYVRAAVRRQRFFLLHGHG